ncbi:MAG TPA: serine hydrolase [Streptosporangiaceae bacterium]|nr:serine hydrolase [Streptosporangiaceae bacterium]
MTFAADRPPAGPGLMRGAPPFPAGSLVTLANWQDPPFNRWAFQHIRELIPTARISRGDGPAWPLPRAERDLAGIRFSTGDGEMSVAELLAQTYTDGFLVLHRGAVVTERYANGLRPDVPHLLMSVSKSLTSTVAGVLAGRGALDVTAPLQRVVPELGATSFAGATVQDLLDMRAGTHFDEDYDNPQADVRTYQRVYLWRPDDGSPRADGALAYFATLHNDGQHGGPFRYRSILTDVLGWVLERAGGARFHELVARELWQPMGAEFDAEVTVDGHGNAMADGGVCATLRDLGRFGLLALGRGRANGRVVAPAAWFEDTLAGAPDSRPAFVAHEGADGFPQQAHYRNCWWVREPAVPFFYASGINGQHVFVHGPSETVVVKLSTWPVATSPDMREATVAAVTAIARALQDGQA